MLKLNHQFSLTIEEAFKEFLNSKKAKGISDKTIATYSQHFSAVSYNLDTASEISNLTKKDLEAMIVGLQKRELSPNSIRSYTATFQSFLSWCKEEGYANISIPLYKGKETIKDTYTNDELKKLLAKPDLKKCSFPDYRNWVIVNMLLNSGCRASTIRFILQKDVSLDEGFIRYRHTKNGSVQIVPLCQEMRKILKEYMRARGGTENDYLFPSQEDTQLTENGLSEAIRRYNRSRGVSKTSIHLFRHSYAERYLRAGGDPFTLQRILGHSTLDMTKHYCQLYDVDIVRHYDELSPLQRMKLT